MPAPGQEETVRIVALDRDFHVHCYRCEVCGQRPTPCQAHQSQIFINITIIKSGRALSACVHLTWGFTRDL